MKSALRGGAASLFAGFARAVTGVRPIWQGSAPDGRQRIYFANHASHGDFILLSACLPPAERERTRAVAAADYWGESRMRRLIAEDLLRSVLIERNGASRTGDPLQGMVDVLDRGLSLIIFPEGTRNMEPDRGLQPFRSGLYNLAQRRPDVELVPCFIENMSRVLPKGEFLPVPLLCRVVFGAPVRPGPDEERRLFLDRARETLAALDPRRGKHA